MAHRVSQTLSLRAIPEEGREDFIKQLEAAGHKVKLSDNKRDVLLEAESDEALKEARDSIRQGIVDATPGEDDDFNELVGDEPDPERDATDEDLPPGV